MKEARVLDSALRLQWHQELIPTYYVGRYGYPCALWQHTKRFDVLKQKTHSQRIIPDEPVKKRLTSGWELQNRVYATEQVNCGDFLGETFN